MTGLKTREGEDVRREKVKNENRKRRGKTGKDFFSEKRERKQLILKNTKIQSYKVTK
jgi:hypothetical protein